MFPIWMTKCCFLRLHLFLAKLNECMIHVIQIRLILESEWLTKVEFS